MFKDRAAVMIMELSIHIFIAKFSALTATRLRRLLTGMSPQRVNKVMQRNPYDPNSYSWFNLNIDVTAAVRPEVVAGLELQDGMGVWVFKPQDILTPQWLADNTIDILHVYVFQRTVTRSDPEAHVDRYGDQSADLLDPQHWMNAPAAINWCFGEDDRPQKWYRDAGHPGVINTFHSSLGIAGGYTTWPVSQLTMVDQCLIGNTARLIRIDQPHSISAGTGLRTSISLRLPPWTMNWAEIVKHFSHLISID